MNIDSKNIIFGRNPIKEAIKANRVVKIFISNSFNHRELLQIISDHKIIKIIKTKNELDLMCKGGVHQGIAAEIKPYEYVSLDYLLHKGSKEKRPIILLLDGINDPHNLGAIIRCCDVFSVVGVVIAKRHQVMLNATVAKTSAGAINYVPVSLVSNMNQAIQTLKDNGYWVVSADGSGNTSYLDLDYDFPTALVIGSEGEGIAPLILKNSDYIVKIPMHGKVNSLNASVATGILLSKIKEA